MRKRLRIAILTHSTNPRGGVVHALELGEALCRLGHDATVYAPDTTGAGFFRNTSCRTSTLLASRTPLDVTAMVEARIADYVRHFEPAQRRCFDIWHAQDGISGNALATLKARGLISAFARTVHHLDDFEDARLAALQLRAVTAADCLFTVSRLWRDWLARETNRDASHVGNGVDRGRFVPARDATDAVLAERLRLPPDAPMFLAVGGVEERKNTIRVLEAFCLLRSRYPSCRLVIAGGASLLDHGTYQSRFAAALERSGMPEGTVIQIGRWPQELMPALFRAATTLIFASIREGFGLVVLEAMASGTPVVTSRLPPFTEYLAAHDVMWCDPYDSASIAAAMAASLEPARRGALIERGHRIAADHDWLPTARAHLPGYAKLMEIAYA